MTHNESWNVLLYLRDPSGYFDCTWFKGLHNPSEYNGTTRLACWQGGDGDQKHIVKRSEMLFIFQYISQSSYVVALC